jgi:8-oxo-dGTP pyrophosphatase MutT (NUDIX family)
MSNPESPPGAFNAGADPARRLLGGPAPWAALPIERRRPISLASVLGALDAAGQLGPVPPGPATADDPFAAWRSHLPMGAPAGEPGGSAVLAALFEEGGEARVVLTRRSSALRTHRGQVSFPGGRIDAGEDAATAALREAHEEIGLDPAAVDVVGWLHPLFTLNAALVLPVVGVLKSRPAFHPNPGEVARVFDVELAELLGDGVYRSDTWDPYEEWSTTGPNRRELWFFDVEGERVWGATARILHELSMIALGLSVATED